MCSLFKLLAKKHQKMAQKLKATPTSTPTATPTSPLGQEAHKVFQDHPDPDYVSCCSFLIRTHCRFIYFDILLKGGRKYLVPIFMVGALITMVYDL